MLDEVLKLFYFFLPGYFANMLPSIVGDLKLFENLKVPLDFKKKIKGKRILGDHKTLRGLIFGMLGGMLCAIFQSFFYQYSFFKNLSLVDYNFKNAIILGFLLSFGVLLGDILFSFFKRQKNIPPGKPWIPFDEIDYTFGVFLIGAPFLPLALKDWFFLFLINLFLHFGGNILGFILGLRKKPI